MFGHKSDPSRIYSYKAREPITGREAVLLQMQAAHRYRNALIELERTRRARVDEAVRRHAPAVVEAEARIAALDAAIDQAEAGIKRRNAEARRRTATKDDRNALAVLKAERKECYAELKIAKTDAYGDPTRADELAAMDPDDPGFSTLYREVKGDPSLRAELTAIDRETNERQKELRAASGLYWGSYLLVEQARGKDRTGAPPEFRGWAGEGHAAVAVQLQSTRPLDVQSLMGCRDSRLRLRILPLGPDADPESNRSRTKSRAVASVRVGTDPDGRTPIWAEIPFHLSRPLPPDCQVKWAYLHRRIVAGVEYPEDFADRLAEARDGRKTRARYSVEWEIQFVVSQDEGAWQKPGRAIDGVAGLDVGWRLVDDGLRVAVLAGSDGHEEELVIPHGWLTAWSRVESLYSIRDREFDAARARLAAWLGERNGTVPEWLSEAAKYLPAWKSPNRLAALAWRWKDGDRRFAGDESIVRELEAWRKQDRHLCDWAASQARQAIARRDDRYRRFADGIARRYATINVEDTNWRVLQGRPQADATADEVNSTAAARVNHRIAAVGRLLQCVREAAGVVAKKPAKRSTMRCHACGKIERWDAARELFHTCSGCGETWDQDRNAARNLRDWDRWGGDVPAVAAAAAEDDGAE